MPEKIGKYRIIERIGRGGMGMIFKAHDPVLDRLVALKVISTDVEITDELRARFFREAQACAQLSHPNIVTVHAMGDDDGQLYIVMELLEGEELKHLIAERRALALEDKLSIMIQVCDGLHYAHQKGIVHRDIKPGNIFLLRNGQIKILDFGIAHMANADGLTRAGLIMGSLRYISPEQVSGRVDQRSDIYSVGAVFYELLTMRPPFAGEDSLHLLAQLRTDEPPAPDQLDPTIPPALAAVVMRAMRKDPAERFPDLARMRSQLEEVQRDLTEEAQRLRARVGDQHGQLLELRAALAERTGPSRQDEPVPTVNERARLATLQALERDLSAQIEALQARITRADSLVPALGRATALVQAGQWADAVGQFEAIVAEMPEHGRALDGLDAEAKSTAAQTAYIQSAFGRASEIFNEASDLYGRAEAAAAAYRRAEAVAREAEQRQAVDETILQSERALDSPAVLAEPAVLIGTSPALDGPPSVVASPPAASVEAMPRQTPTPPQGERTTRVPVGDLHEAVPGSRRGVRRVAMAVLGGVAAIGLGALLLWLPRAPSTGPNPRPSVTPGESASPAPGAAQVVAEVPHAAPSGTGRQDAPSSPHVERAADPPAIPPPRMVDTPLTPRQALREVFEGRNPAHSVTATVVKDAVRTGRDNVRVSITSSRPGYVYVMVARSNGSDVELLLPNAAETNNHIEPGRPLTLPGPRGPLKTQGRPGTNEFLAIVSDEPRDFSGLGPPSGNVSTTLRPGHRRLDHGPSRSAPLFAGTVACASAAPCSESYGAAAFSMDTVRWEPDARQAAPRPPAATPPAARARHETSPRCSGILERASLGEPLTEEEQTMLTRECR